MTATPLTTTNPDRGPRVATPAAVNDRTPRQGRRNHVGRAGPDRQPSDVGPPTPDEQAWVTPRRDGGDPADAVLRLLRSV